MIIISREPDRPELEPLVGAAQNEHFAVVFSRSVTAVQAELKEGQRHVLVYDQLLPPGPDVQRDPCCLGIAVLTDGSPSALAEALDCGGDDAFDLSIHPLEFQARLRRFRRRRARACSEFGDFLLDTVSRLLWYRNEPVVLHEHEVQLLRTLAVNPTRLLSPAEVAAALGIPSGRSELEQIEHRLMGVSARVLRVTGQRLLVTTDYLRGGQKLLMINPRLLQRSSSGPE